MKRLALSRESTCLDPASEAALPSTQGATTRSARAFRGEATPRRGTFREIAGQWRCVGLILVAILLTGADGDDCRTDTPRMDRDAYLRALSLDLRGVIPTEDEFAAIASAPDVPSSLIESWLASPEFAARAARRHRALLWPSIRNQALINFRQMLLPVASADGNYRWYRGFLARSVRGGEGPACLDEPATFDAAGLPVTRLDENGARIEGWLDVHPYWAPETTLRVCALDAQDTEVSRVTGMRCATSAGNFSSSDCGCGADLRWCFHSQIHDDVLTSLQTDFEKRIEANILDDEPYVNVFFSRRAFVNGPIANFYRHYLEMVEAISLAPIPWPDDELPRLGPNDKDTWVELQLPPEHAGLLSSPVYLLRFQTNRARANRFYEAFLCQPMQPPNGGLPLATPTEQRMNDLQQRPGCRYCHAILEPAAAYWGRWSQQSANYLSPEDYPEFVQECRDCASGVTGCSTRCAQSYVVSALSPESQPYLGYLRAYEHLRPEHRDHVDQGPLGLVRETITDGRFLSCTVRHTAEWLLGRALSAEDEPLEEAVVARLLDSQLSYRDAVRELVTSETYRRTR
jgi:hypothetical protein